MKLLIFLCLIWIGDAIYALYVNENMYTFEEGGRTPNIISLAASVILLPVLVKLDRARSDRERAEFLYEHDPEFREDVDIRTTYWPAAHMKRDEPELFNEILSGMRSTENHAARRNEFRQQNPDWSKEDIDTAFVASFLREAGRSQNDRVESRRDA